MVFRPEGVVMPLEFRTISSHTSTAMSDTMGVDLGGFPRRPGDPDHMSGYEGSDLVAVYYALDKLGEIAGPREVEVVGDGQAIEMLRGTGRVSARWGGRDWAPDLVARIREAEKGFDTVAYRTIASRVNPAGADAKYVRFQNLRRRKGRGFR
jgi:hypothetical protein